MITSNKATMSTEKQDSRTPVAKAASITGLNDELALCLCVMSYDDTPLQPFS
jgi:hypothetical protein